MPLFGPTTNHSEIRAWAQANQATPAQIRPIIFDGEPAVLRFIFGERRIETPEIEPISWDDFFAHFDTMGLSLVYETEANKDASCRYELLQRESRDPYVFRRLEH